VYIWPQLYRLRHLIGCNLNHRSRIYLPGIKTIVDDREDDDSTCHQTSDIHVRSIWVDENEENDCIPHTKGIEKDSPDTRDVERTPDQFVRVPGGAGHWARVADRSPHSVPEEERLGEEVGGVEAADADGDNVVERSCGTDVDQADGARTAGHDHECVHWDSGAWWNL